MSLRTLTGLYIISFLLVSVYLIFRAIHVPLVHDEAETFFIYFVNFDFLPYQGWISANNHFINSFLGAICYRMFGASEWALRLPNLLSLPIYGYYLFKLSGMIDNQNIRLGLLLALITAPFYIEFFTLARGYGMSMALLTPYLYYVTRYLTDKKKRHFTRALIFGLICILASLTCFYIFLIVTLILALELYLEFKKGIRIHIMYKVSLLFLLQVIPALYFIKYIIHLGTINELVVGTLDGFYFVTVAPLIFYLTGSHSAMVAGMFIAIFALSLIFFIVQFLKLKSIVFFVKPENLIPTILFLSLLHIAFNGYVLEIPFPRDRAALFLFPLFIFTFCIFLDRLNLGPVFSGFFYVLLLFFPVSLLFSANLTHSLYWKAKYINPIYYDYILENQGDEISTIGSLSLRETIWYHKIFSHERKLNPLSINNAETDNICDFKIQPADVNPSILEDYRLVFEDSIAGNNLYERVNKAARIPEDTGLILPFKGNSMYHDFIVVPMDESQATLPFLLEVELTVIASNIPFEFSTYVKLVDKDGQLISDQSVRMSRLKYNWKENAPYTLLFTIDSLPAQTDKIVAFISNNYEREYELERGSYKLYKLVTE